MLAVVSIFWGSRKWGPTAQKALTNVSSNLSRIPHSYQIIAREDKGFRGIDFNRSPVTVFMTANIQQTQPMPKPEVRSDTDASGSGEPGPDPGTVTGLSAVPGSYGREGRALNVLDG